MIGKSPEQNLTIELIVSRQESILDKHQVLHANSGRRAQT